MEDPANLILNRHRALKPIYTKYNADALLYIAAFKDYARPMQLA
jgi:hypothetical protein